MTKAGSEKAKVVYDDFTKRLVAVFNELVMIPAIAKVMDFTNTIGYEMSSWALVRNRQRNYPRRRQQAAKNMLEKVYGVNPLYMDGISERMFIRKPRKLEVDGPLDYLLLDFQNKQKKRVLLEELQDTRDVNEHLREQLHVLQEQNEAYKRLLEAEKSDKKTDKPTPKPRKSGK